MILGYQNAALRRSPNPQVLRSYSLLTIVQTEDNFSPIERVLAQLMLRDLGALQTTVLDFRVQGSGSDATITIPSLMVSQSPRS